MRIAAPETHNRLEQDLAHGIHQVRLLDDQVLHGVGVDLAAPFRRVLVQVVDLDGVLQKRRSRRRQLQALFAAQKRHAELLLQFGDVLAEIGLGRVQVGCRGREIQVVCQHDVFVQRFDLHAAAPCRL